MPGKQHMKGVSPKRNRQYEHIKEQLEENGKDEDSAKEEAARTVNKTRRKHHELKGESHVTSVEFIPGPLTSEVTRTAAESGLQNHPAIRKGAGYALEQVDGRWIAAIIHEAEFPPSGGDEEEESPAPKAEGPSDSGDSAGPSDSGGGSDGPPSGDEGGDSEDGSSKKKKGGELHELIAMIQAIADGLGIQLPMGGLGDDSADPMGGPAGPPGPGGPPGMGGPPAPPGPPGMGGGPNEQHVIHEKTMKPGETPPGGTPVGAPAFASVREDHPWAHLAGKVASWEVVERIGDEPMNKVAKELDSLSREIGYRFDLREDRDQDGNRVAVALITKH